MPTTRSFTCPTNLLHVSTLLPPSPIGMPPRSTWLHTLSLWGSSAEGFHSPFQAPTPSAGAHLFIGALFTQLGLRHSALGHRSSLLF